MSEQDGSLTGPPAPASARFEALDALRGFAVLGIFVINIIGFSMPEIAMSDPRGHSMHDRSNPSGGMADQ